MIRVLVVHKVRLTCELTVAALNEESNIHVADFARSADEAMAKMAQKRYDVALVSISLPNQDALRITHAAARGTMGVKVLITGLVESKAAVLRCIEAGAAGYVLEEDSLPDLVKKICAVADNRFFVAPKMAGALMVRLAELKRQVTSIHALRQFDSYDKPTELTAREWEIVGLIEQGFTNQQIAGRLVIELGTVKNHVHNILRKLGVQSRQHAVIFARHLRMSGVSPAAPTPVVAVGAANHDAFQRVSVA